MNILIADDSPVSVKFLDKLLQSWGHRTTTASDGEKAWAEIKNDASTKLCIIDWDMPGLTGIEICKKVREEKLDRYIILLTAKDDIEDISEGLESGADDYICKPFRQEELKMRIRSAFRLLSLEKQLGVTHAEANFDDNTDTQSQKSMSADG